MSISVVIVNKNRFSPRFREVAPFILDLRFNIKKPSRTENSCLIKLIIAMFKISVSVAHFKTILNRFTKL